MTTLFRTIPLLAKELSSNSIARGFTIVIQLWYFVLTRKAFRPTRDFELVVHHEGKHITFYLRHPMDIAVLKEVFLTREYEWFPINNPKLIVDLGAHFGDTTLYYHAHFPEATIIAVEPSPENYERLVKHTERISNIIPVQAAVGASDGEAMLNIVPSSLGHSLVQRKDTKQIVTVPQVTLATLFKKYGVDKADIIKFDIEGGEYALFENAKPEDFATAYIGEVHPDLVESIQDFSEQFNNFSVTKTKINNRRYLIRAIEK